MKIIIDVSNTGLGNNGGSRTIILCAETLSKLGHDVSIFSNVKNNYSWHKIRGVKILSGTCPPCDVAISTTPKSVSHTLSMKAKRKFYYIRGYEIFWCPVKMVHNSYKKLPCIVNSKWLQLLLKMQGISSEIVYPGLDFDIFYNYEKDRNNQIGGLFHKRHKTKNHRHIDQVAASLGTKAVMLNREISSPKPKELRDFYNNIKVWMAPTELEGLHNPPMEASLCGCGLVSNDCHRNGMTDYAIHTETALVYPAGDLEIAEQYVKLLLEDEELRQKLNRNMVDLLRSKIGDRISNMKKLVEIIS